MIKTLLRTLAYLVTSLAFCLAFVDGVRSIDKGSAIFTSLQEFGSYMGVKTPETAPKLLQSLVDAPASLSLFGLGVIIMLIGRKRRLIMPELRTK